MINYLELFTENTRKYWNDKALCDWLVAVTDDEDLVREHINEFDTDTVYRLLAIFRRVNKIDEREEKLKNVATPGTKAV